MRRVIVRGDGIHALIEVMQALNKCKPINVIHVIKSSVIGQQLQQYCMLNMIALDTVRADTEYVAAIVIDDCDYDKSEVIDGGSIHLVGRSKRK